MKILWLVTNPRENPSTRFRVLQYVKPFALQGIQVTVQSLVSSAMYTTPRGSGNRFMKWIWFVWATLKRGVDVMRAGRYDAVVVLREVYPFGPPLLESWLRHMNKKIIYEFDDAVYRPFDAVNNPLDHWRDFSKPRRLIQSSRLTVAGSQALRDYAQQFSNQVQVIPTVVDPQQYPIKSHTRSGAEVIIGWMGTRNNLLHLSLIESILARLQQRFGFCLRIVSDRPFQSRSGLLVENIVWSESTEVENLQSFDIGLMPLLDDEFSRGKCAFKIIQYMANALPTVCSPVGENQHVIEDGRTGYLAKSTEEWECALEKLISKPAWRQQMGNAARQVVEKKYSLNAGLEAWLQIFSRMR